MFSPFYFAPTFFPPSYFAESGGSPTPVVSVYSAPSYFPPSFYAPTYFQGITGGSSTSIPLGHGLFLARLGLRAAVVYADFWEAMTAWVGAKVPGLAGPYYSRAPRDTALPFAVYSAGGASVDYMSGSPSLQSGSFALAIYSTDIVQARSLARAVRASLRDAQLMFAEGNMHYIRADSIYEGVLDPDPGPAGVNVWQCVVNVNYQYSTNT